MADPSDDLDEVVLNVLLAEGVDVPTAVEASRHSAATAGWGTLWVQQYRLVALTLQLELSSQFPTASGRQKKHC